METVVTDKAGRRLTLRKVGVLETLRLFKALGGELAANDMYLSAAKIAAAVAMIDDVPVPFPASEAAVEAVLQKLDDEDLGVVARAMRAPAVAAVVAEAGN